VINTIFSARHATGQDEEKGGKKIKVAISHLRSWRSRSRCSPVPSSFHAWIPAGAAPRLRRWDPRVKESVLEMEWCWRGARRCCVRREKVMTLACPRARAPGCGAWF